MNYLGQTFSVTALQTDIAREDVQNVHHFLNKRNQQMKIELGHVVVLRPAVSGVVDSSRSVMHVLYTLSHNVSHNALNWIQVWQIWRPPFRWGTF